MHANTIETTANQQGWTLHTGFAGGQWLETSSPAGEDLIIDVPSGRPIPETVHEHAEQFDPDEHVRALVRSPMKGQPGTIAELLEDAKAIQTMLDRLDAALSAPPDDDPHWEQWTAEALDEMLDDVAHKASSLAQTVLWHHHAANHGIETPENTRRQCLDTLDDLRDLMAPHALSRRRGSHQSWKRRLSNGNSAPARRSSRPRKVVSLPKGFAPNSAYCSIMRSVRRGRQGKREGGRAREGCRRRIRRFGEIHVRPQAGRCALHSGAASRPGVLHFELAGA